VIDVGTTASTTIAGVPTASGGLPFTGSGSGSLAAFGALATVFGAALLARRRRRPLT
jgi:LPXTG-motif cell wall-anchored protein